MAQQERANESPSVEGLKIGVGDPRYRAVVDKQFNKRFTASPE